MELTCKLHSIETLGTVDGPGIRFVVFLSGCPLKCKYCHNRDTWDMSNGKDLSLDKLIKKIVRSKPYFETSRWTESQYQVVNLYFKLNL